MGRRRENESVEQRRVVGCIVSEAPNLLFSDVGSSVRVDFVLAVAFFHEFFALKMVVGSVLGVRCFSCLIAFLRWPMGHMQPEQEPDWLQNAGVKRLRDDCLQGRLFGMMPIDVVRGVDDEKISHDTAFGSKEHSPFWPIRQRKASNHSVSFKAFAESLFKMRRIFGSFLCPAEAEGFNRVAV